MKLRQHTTCKINGAEEKTVSAAIKTGMQVEQMKEGLRSDLILQNELELKGNGLRFESRKEKQMEQKRK